MVVSRFVHFVSGRSCSAGRTSVVATPRPPSLTNRLGGSAADGFTLIELMISLAVFSILIMIATPSFNGTIVRTRLQAQGSTLVTDVMLARSEAVRRSSPVTICPSTDGATCGGTWQNGRIVFSDAAGDGVVNASDTVVRVYAEFNATDTLTATPAVNRLTFATDGTLGSTVSFSVCHTGFQGWTVQIASVGRASQSQQTATCS